MDDPKPDQQQQAAYQHLVDEGLSYGDTAVMLGVTTRTIQRWVTKFGWSDAITTARSDHFAMVALTNRARAEAARTERLAVAIDLEETAWARLSVILEEPDNRKTMTQDQERAARFALQAVNTVADRLAKLLDGAAPDSALELLGDALALADEPHLADEPQPEESTS